MYSQFITLLNNVDYGVYDPRKTQGVKTGVGKMPIYENSVGKLNEVNVDVKTLIKDLVE